MLKWNNDRIKTGCEKLKLWKVGTPYSGAAAYLLRYNVGDYAPFRTEQGANKKHYRLNIELVRAQIGGELFVEAPIFRFWRICFFRSDLSRHAVQEVRRGSRLVASLGWVC